MSPTDTIWQRQGVHLAMPEKEYHSDPGETPTLSASTATKLTDLGSTPLHAYLSHPRLGAASHPPTDAMRLGSAAHALALDQSDSVSILDYDNWKKPAARDERTAALHEGTTPINQTEFRRISDRVLSAKTLLAHTATGSEANEVTLMWTDDGVDCRSRLDRLVLDGDVGIAWVYDLKFRGQPSPSRLPSTAWDSGDDIQAHAYTRAVETIWPEFAGRVEFLFLIIPLAAGIPGYRVELDNSTKALGESRWTAARETWRRCLAADAWPGYPDQTLTLNKHAVKRWLEAQCSHDSYDPEV